jgi:Signal transduction histidine kinase
VKRQPQEPQEPQEPGVRSSIAEARTHIQVAVKDLRELARGVYPVLLSQGGLGTALRALPEQLEVPVLLSISEAAPPVQLRPAVEHTAYFAVMEWIIGAGGTKASRIVVDVSVARDRVEIWTGVTAPRSLRATNGGAPAADTTMRLSNSLHDRILALGGSCDPVQPDGERQGGFHVTIPVIP